MSLPELVFVSNLFPDARDSYRGRPNAIILHGLREEFRIRVLSPRPSLTRTRFEVRPGDEPLEPQHFTVPYVPKLGGPFNHHLMAWKLGKNLDRLHRERPIAVLLSSWLFPDGCAAAMWAGKAGVPLVMITQGTDTHHYLKYPLRRKAILAAARMAERIICRSKDLGRLLHDAGVPSEKLVTIYNGVDPELFRPQSQGEARAELGLPPAAKCVLFVGNLVEVKNPLLLVEAVAQAEKRIGEPVRLLMAGKGHLKEKILSAAAAYGVADRVHLLGPLPSEKISRYMAAVDVLALCSRNEGMPNVVLEAMACGLPCVCSDVGGIREVLTIPDCGQLVPEGSVRAFGEALTTALTGTFQRDRIAEYGSRYSWNATFRHYAEVLRTSMRPLPGAPPVGGSGRRRLMFVSNLFPDVRQSYRGQDNARILHRLTDEYDVEVLSPRPALWPRSYGSREEDAALAPLHFSVPYVPRFGSRWNHRLMAWRLVPTMAERHAKKPADVVLASWLFPDG